MKGCRPLTQEEIDAVKEALLDPESKEALRNYTLFMFMLYTGFRVSEVLSIRVRDVYNVGNGTVSSYVYLQKANTKKQIAGRSITLNEKIRDELKTYIEKSGLNTQARLIKGVYLFPSIRDPTFHISRVTVHLLLKNAYEKAGLTGKLACHTTRKSFATRVSESCNGDLMVIKEAMGHLQVSSTACYLNVEQKKIDGIISSFDF